jgi:hypothetical protein
MRSYAPPSKCFEENEIHNTQDIIKESYSLKETILQKAFFK